MLGLIASIISMQILSIYESIWECLPESNLEVQRVTPTIEINRLGSGWVDGSSRNLIKLAQTHCIYG